MKTVVRHILHSTAVRRPRGFTLIELLVVIGIIALLAAAIGIGLRGGDQTVALQAGQSTVASLVSATRGRAALANQNAALMVNANDQAPDRYLRLLAVGVNDGSGTFVPTGDGVLLPAGVFVVPPAWQERAAPEVGENWSNLNSDLLQNTVEFLLDGVTDEDWYSFEMTSFGGKAGGGSRLVLSTAARTEDGLVFTNPNNVRGVTISVYGVATLIDNPNVLQQSGN